MPEFTKPMPTELSESELAAILKHHTTQLSQRFNSIHLPDRRKDIESAIETTRRILDLLMEAERLVVLDR